MNPNIAHIGNGNEIHGSDEYDPFGSYIYKIGNVRHEKCNLEEAIQNMTDEQMATYKKLCIQARIGDAIILKAIAHDYLMGCAQRYWSRIEKRIEGEASASENVFEDGYCR